MKLFLANFLGEIKIRIPFSLILSLPFSHNPALKKVTLVSSLGTGRHLQITSLEALLRNHVC